MSVVFVLASALAAFIFRVLKWLGLAQEPPKDGGARASRGPLSPINEGFEPSFDDLVEEDYPPTPEACRLSSWNSSIKEVETVVWKRGKKYGVLSLDLMQNKIEHLEACMETRNVHALISAVRSGVQRDFLGFYNRIEKHGGPLSRKLINKYTRLVTVALSEMFCVENSLLADMSLQQRLDILNDLRTTHGRTALLLSGGSTFGANHLGVVKNMWETGHLPRVISGSSAGSVIASIICSKTDEELKHKLRFDEEEGVAEADVGINLKTFDDLHGWPSLIRKVHRLLSRGVLLDIKVIERAMQDNIGNITFLEAYNKTGRILNITVVPTKSYEKLRLLNYLTAPNVLVWSAVCASCSLPFLFEATQLIAKDKNGKLVPYHSMSDMKWSDGSVGYDLPKDRLTEMFNTSHFIVSQTNPLILHFLPSHNPLSRCNVIDRAIRCVKNLIRTEFIHRADQLARLGLVPKLMLDVITQSYDGDITIVPKVEFRDYFRLFSNPTIPDLKRAIRKGTSAARPHMSSIRACCEAEMMMDRCARQLRLKIEENQQSERSMQETAYKERAPGQRVPSWVALHHN